MDMKSLAKGGTDLIKLGLSGALICAIGWGFLVLDESGDVTDVEADIVTEVPKVAVTGANFAQVMDKSGMTPRPYEINGNDVFFAVGYTKNSPEELLEAYQERFVTAGINDQKYLEVPASKMTRTLDDIANLRTEMSEYEQKYTGAMLKGGVVPLVKTPGQVTMGGTVPKGTDGGRLKDVFPEWNMADARGPQLGELMEGFRFIEAKRLSEDGMTRVTSVWADKDFSYAKMNKPQKEGLRPVVEAPACMGCEIGTQMRSRDPNERLRSSHMITSRSIQQTHDFYRAAMKNRGWAATDASSAINYAREQLGVLDDVDLMSFQRNGVESTILIFRDPQEGQTRVSITETY